MEICPYPCLVLAVVPQDIVVQRSCKLCSSVGPLQWHLLQKYGRGHGKSATDFAAALQGFRPLAP